MARNDIEDIKLYIDKRFDQLLDSFHSQSETTQMTICDRDYQRDTYILVKELKFNLEQDKINKELEKMKEEYKNLGLKIQNLEMTKNYKEADYFRSN